MAAAVRDSRITMAEALRRYQLTEEEFRSWQRAFERHGLAGLRATRIQQYRQKRQLQQIEKTVLAFRPGSVATKPAVPAHRGRTKHVRNDLVRRPAIESFLRYNESTRGRAHCRW